MAQPTYTRTPAERTTRALQLEGMAVFARQRGDDATAVLCARQARRLRKTTARLLGHQS